MEIVNTNTELTNRGEYQSLLNEFLRDKSGKAPKTRETYLKNIKAFVSWINERGITEPSKTNLIEYEAYLTATYKPTTARAYFNTVKMFFSWLYNEGLLIQNPASNVSSNAKISKEFKKAFLTEEQARELLGSVDRTKAKGKRDFSILLICLCCGLRTIELERANIGDIKEHSFGRVLFVQGKGRQEKDQLVKIPDSLYFALLDYLATRGITPGNIEEHLNEPLFVSEASNHIEHRIAKESISRLIKGYLRGIGLNSSLYSAHALRHTAATLNLINGGSLEETQQLLRHANITTTMIYNHSLERAKNQSENRLASIILGGK